MKKIFLLGIFSLALLLTFASCTATTDRPARSQAETTEATYYETSGQNLSDMFDAQEKALKISKERTIDIELQAQVTSVQTQARLDPIKYPAQDVAAEISRLYALAARKKEQFADAQANFRKLKEQDAATNIQGARRIRDKLRGPLPATTPLNTPIATATGKQSSATLIEP